MRYRETRAVVRKELASYFATPVAYIVITVFLAVTGWFFFSTFFLYGQAELRAFFQLLPLMLSFVVPAVTMRLFAEEKHSGSFEILMTLPVSTRDVVAGKMLAGSIFVMIMLAPTILYAVSVALVGSLDPGPMIGGYIGAALLGGAYSAIGVFASSLTKNQIVAFILTILLSFTLFILGEDVILVNLPDFWVPFFSFLGLGKHFVSIQRGIIDSRDIVYYLSVTGFFLFLNVLFVTKRR